MLVYQRVISLSSASSDALPPSQPPNTVDTPTWGRSRKQQTATITQLGARNPTKTITSNKEPTLNSKHFSKHQHTIITRIIKQQTVIKKKQSLNPSIPFPEGRILGNIWE